MIMANSSPAATFPIFFSIFGIFNLMTSKHRCIEKKVGSRWPVLPSQGTDECCCYSFPYATSRIILRTKVWMKIALCLKSKQSAISPLKCPICT